jgi:hypothetical protein
MKLVDPIGYVHVSIKAGRVSSPSCCALVLRAARNLQALVSREDDEP